MSIFPSRSFTSGTFYSYVPSCII